MDYFYTSVLKQRYGWFRTRCNKSTLLLLSFFNGIVKAGYRPTVSRTNVWHNGTEGLNQYMAGSDTGGVTVLF